MTAPVNRPDVNHAITDLQKRIRALEATPGGPNVGIIFNYDNEGGYLDITTNDQDGSSVGLSLIDTNHGIKIRETGDSGLYIGDEGDGGVDIETLGDGGIRITDNGSTSTGGVRIASNASDGGVNISDNGAGLSIGEFGDGGVLIKNQGAGSLTISNIGNGGTQISDTGSGGMVNRETSSGGIVINDQGSGGLEFVEDGDSNITTNANGNGHIFMNTNGTGTIQIVSASGIVAIKDTVNVIEIDSTTGITINSDYPGTGIAGHNVTIIAGGGVGGTGTSNNYVQLEPALQLPAYTTEPSFASGNSWLLYTYDDSSGHIKLRAYCPDTGTRVTLATA